MTAVILNRWRMRRLLWPLCAPQRHPLTFWLPRRINGEVFAEVGRCSCGARTEQWPVPEQRGSMLIDWLLALAFILLPVIGLAGAALNWPGRLNAAAGAAYEAAHSVVSSSSADEGEGQARAEEVWANHGYDTSDISVSFSGDPTVAGSELTATVQVVLPAIAIPGVGRVAGGTVSRSHSERVPDFGTQS